MSPAADAHPDLRHVKPRHGVRLTSRLTPQLAFGLLPAEAEVLWGYVPISGQVIAAQQLTSLSTVSWNCVTAWHSAQCCYARNGTKPGVRTECADISCATFAFGFQPDPILNRCRSC